MATVPDEFDDSGDAELIEAVRDGSTEAYGALYQRHVAAAYNMARQVAKSASETDDLVSEAFAKVLTGLRSGQGPNTAFRAYLLTAIRNTAYDRTRRDRKIHYSEDVGEESGADVGVPFTDTAIAGLERSLAANAFHKLPERWQTVLWHLEIEGQSPAEVAPLLGLTPNGVSALAYRAREGLRQSYLQVHLAQLEATGEDAEHCRAAVERLGSWTRGGLSKRETTQVDAHLDGCGRCRALAAELADVNGGLRVVVAPLVLGVGAAGYLAANSGTAAGVGAAAGTTAGAAGGAGAAANAAGSLPRQVLASVASTAALVVVVALGLTAGADRPEPVAAPPPPPEQPTPRPPEPREPAPDPPAPEPQPAQPAPKPAPQPPPPEPKPDLVGSGPGRPVHLIAGGPAEALPVTIRNNGEATSRPITAKLALPAGITAELPGADGGSAEGSSASPAARDSAPGQPASTAPAWFSAKDASGPNVDCTRSGSALTCRTERGLRPGESLPLDFRVQAARNAKSGDVRIDISSAGGLTLSLADVVVRVRPEPEPAIELSARGWTGPIPWGTARVHARAENSGTVSGTVRIVFTLPSRTSPVHVPAGCSHRGDTVRCTGKVAPGEQEAVTMWLASEGIPHWPRDEQRPDEQQHLDEHGHRSDHPSASHPPVPTLPAVELNRTEPVEITAKLFEATDHETVRLGPWWAWLPGHPGGEPSGESEWHTPETAATGQSESNENSPPGQDSKPRTPSMTSSRPTGESGEAPTNTPSDEPTSAPSSRPSPSTPSETADPSPSSPTRPTSETGEGGRPEYDKGRGKQGRGKHGRHGDRAPSGPRWLDRIPGDRHGLLRTGDT